MFIVMTTRDGVLDELVAIEVDREIAINKFLDTCRTQISCWEEYTSDDVDAILDDGYVEFIDRVIMYIDTSNVKSDQDISNEIVAKFLDRVI